MQCRASLFLWDKFLRDATARAQPNNQQPHMPYVGVRTVLKAADLIRHAQKFVEVLGVETINDLNELKEADLAHIGLGAEFPRFRQELERVLVPVGSSAAASPHLLGRAGGGGAAGGAGGRGGPRSSENKFQKRRRLATEAILAVGAANASVGNNTDENVHQYSGHRGGGARSSASSGCRIELVDLAVDGT